MIPSRDDLKKFFSVLEERKKIPVLLVYASGIKVSEIPSLRVGDLNLENMKIKVADRETIIPVSLKEKLIKIIEDRESEYLLFVGRGGRGAVGENTLRNWIREASRLSGVKCTSEDLRKAFVFHSLESGMDPRMVRAASGYTRDVIRRIKQQAIPNISSPADLDT